MSKVKFLFLVLSTVNTTLYIDSWYCKHRREPAAESIHFLLAEKCQTPLTTGIYEAPAMSSPSCKSFSNNQPTQLAYRTVEDHFSCYYSVNMEWDIMFCFFFPRKFNGTFPGSTNENILSVFQLQSHSVTYCNGQCSILKAFQAIHKELFTAPCFFFPSFFHFHFNLLLTSFEGWGRNHCRWLTGSVS